MKKSGNFNPEQSRRAITKRISSGRKSRFLAMQQNFHRVVAILALAFVCSGAWAEKYVFISNENNGYFIGSDAKATQIFTVGTCVWTCYSNSSGTTESTLGTNNSYLRNGDDTYLDGAKGKTGIVSTGTSRNGYWRANGSNLCYYASNDKVRQVYRNNTDVQWRDGDAQSNGFRVYTYEEISASLSPTIQGKSFLNANGTYPYTSTSDAIPLHYKFTGPDTRYYATGDDGATTTKPTGTAATGVTYTYSLSTNSYATVNPSTGEITVTNLPATGTATITLTVTASKEGYTSGTATKEIILTKENYITETGQYVICYNNQYWLGGTNTNRINSFDPETCLWTGTSGGTWQNSAGYYLRYNNDLSLDDENSTRWDINNTYRLKQNGQNRYLRYNSSWTTNNSSSNNNQYNLVYPVTKTTYMEANTDPVISGDNEISAIGYNSSFGVTTEAKRQEDYIDYIFYNGNHHYFNSSGKAVTNPPVTTFSHNTWTLVYADNGAAVPEEYATIGTDGRINYLKSFEEDTQVKVRLTAKATGQADRIAEQTVLFKAMPTFWFKVKMVANPTDGGTATVKNGSNAQVKEYTFSQKAKNASAASLDATVSITATPSSGNYRWQSWTGVTGATAATANNVTVTSTSKNESAPTEITITANFERAPIFYLRAEAVADPETGGTATASIDGGTAASTVTANKNGDFSTHYNNQTFSITYTAVPAENYTFSYWHNGDGTKIDGAGTTYTINNVSAKSKNESEPTVNKLYAKFSTVPTSITAEDLVVGIGAEGQKSIVVTLSPEGSVKYLKYVLDASDQYAFVDENTGLVTGKKAGQTTVTVIAYKDAAKTQKACRCTGNIFVRDLCKVPEIDFAPIDEGFTATTTITTETEGATIYYQVRPDGEERPTEWTEYTEPFVVNNLDKVYAYADKPDDDKYGPSKETNKQYSAHKVATPTISVSATGAVTFDSEDEPGVTYYYTTDGSEPNTSSSSWTKGSPAITGLPNETQVKVIAVKTGCQNSDMATKGVYYTGVVGGTVYLNDYEDHTWTYYAGVDASVDGGNYNNTYLSTAGGSSAAGYGPRMYSPNPRNVKITYKGVGLDGQLGSTVAISKTEPENQMIYYETIEKVQPGEDQDYAYTVIPNPFSKRPKSGDTYYGFGGWKITKGKQYIAEYRNNAADEPVLNLDEKIHFTNLPYPSVNCTSAEIEFEATWVEADVRRQTNKPTFDSGTYETNFWLVSGNASANVTLTDNMTMTQMSPDGGETYDYTGTAITQSIIFNASAVGVTSKIEWLTLDESTAFTASGKNMFIGRGVTNAGSPALQLHTGSSQTNQVVRVESGRFGSLLHYAARPSSVVKQIVTFGCDYDRAKNDNKKLAITNKCVYSNNVDVTSDNTKWGTITRIKSGEFCSPLATASDNTQQGEASYYYMGKETTSTKYNQGCRYLEVQGGDLMNLAGGSLSHSGNEASRTALALRMKGGTFHGIVFGCARGNNCNGSRSMVLTGGHIMGWITSGANGTVDNAGQMDGYSFIYVGGNSKIDSDGNTNVWCHSLPGNVFGAGSGIDRTATRISGSNTMGTNVAIADNAYVERGVYGGGSFGYCTATANIYITGGHVEGKNGGVNNGTNVNTGYNADIQGGVYGGSCQNKGGSSNIYMTGGLVETGIYGGSNAYGVMSDNVKIVIDGGQVGKADNQANVHGGGYGPDTQINGNVDVSIGTYNASTKATTGDAIIYGDVYGGSALGDVNDATSDHTNVSLNGGIINGSLYGGALGNATTAANVYGPVQVTVHGGSVKGEGSAIYGCNNVNGAPKSTVAVDIWNTDPAEVEGDYAINAVYGGGNQANYNGTPSVTVHNCDNSIEYVYGGGNAATVTGTDVLIEGGNVIGNVFGGGYGANVNGDIDLTITGGKIINVFGGNNASGVVTGEIDIIVEQREPNCPEKAEHTAGDGCPIDITKLCGGGNMANSHVANIDIRCCDHIGTVYGGAEAANMDGNIDLQIKAGNIETVFGGNNQSGNITGSITVTANWDKDTYPCESSLGTVYGGGNLAEYSGNTMVNILNCEMTGNVFGGGKGTRSDGTGAHIVGNTTVNIGDWKEGHQVIIAGSVFGGGDEAAVEGNTTVTIRDCATIIETDVYGGGNAAPVYATDVTMWGGNVYGNIFGGGNGQDNSKPGANVGYNRENVKETDATGDAITKVYGGTLGEPDGKGGFKQDTGGIFGGSNSRGEIKRNIDVTLDSKSEATVQTAADKTTWGTCPDDGCELMIREAYGAGNVAEFYGEGITFTLGCIDTFNEIYGGAKNANLEADVHLVITSGHFKKVFAGNNLGGCLKGNMKVTIDEIGCNPIIIDSLYGGGNRAAYSVYGYNNDNTVKTSGEQIYNNPEVEVISCTKIGSIFGGGEGVEAIVVGDPAVNINQIPGNHCDDSSAASYVNDDKLGSIIEVYGGGNAADVNGNTHVNIGTRDTQAHVQFNTTEKKYKPGTGGTKPGANIKGNVYGGGNKANVTGRTNVVVGKK